MARTGGERTKRKIMATAEKLFAEKGYDGTSIQHIATVAGINKALIYYHFKNKQDIVDSLFAQTLDEMFALYNGQAGETSDRGDVEEQIAGIISLLSRKKRILTIMLMEALKNDAGGHRSLFRCAEMVIAHKVSEVMHAHHGSPRKKSERDQLLMHEFFTGFIPVVFFALFKEKWAAYFTCDRQSMVKIFSQVFKESHIRHP